MAFTTTTGAGGTSLIGTSGVDTAAITPSSLVTSLYVGAQAANDIVSVSTGTQQNLRAELGQGVDNFSAAGTLKSSTVSGNLGNDVIAVATLDSSSLINGNQGQDTITITGTVKGSSRVLGGQDNDTITITGASFTGGTVNGNKGNDSVDTSTTDLGAAFSSSTIFGGEGNDSLSFKQSATGYGVFASGDDGNDTIKGSISDVASTGGDTLLGGNGNDSIYAGADEIDKSVDSLSGGAGSDTFYFLGINDGNETTFKNTDIITDFNVSEDKISMNGAFTFNTTVLTSLTGTGTTAGTVSVVSGTISSTGAFTAGAQNAGNFDTAIVVATTTDGTINTDRTYVFLDNVLASTVTAANFIV